MLRAFGLQIVLEPSNEQLLSELAELRNVILHRGGVVDRRFKTNVHGGPTMSAIACSYLTS
jgi:uncharacterized protein YutE (UPF0331/DUF86 family)